MTSGYFRGIWDEWIVMRVVDSIQAFPFLILALIIATVLGGGLGYAMVAIGLTFVPAFVRITRAQVLSIRSRDYVDASRAIGVSHFKIRVRHVLPNSLPPLLVQTSLAMGYAIIAEATLSFLGLGAEPGEPAWAQCFFKLSRTLRRHGGWRSSPAWLYSLSSSALISSVTAFAKL